MLDEYGYRFHARQGRRATRRARRRDDLQRTDDHARPAGRDPPSSRPHRRRRPPLPTIKPLDSEAILRAPAPTGSSVTQNHTIVGGLGGIGRRRPRRSPASDRAVPVAPPDEFLAAGALLTLHDRYGLSTYAIPAKIKAELGADLRPRAGAWPAHPEPATV